MQESRNTTRTILGHTLSYTRVVPAEGRRRAIRRPDHAHFRVANHLFSVRTLAAFAALLALAIFAPASLHAQDPDIIRGRVTGPDSLPIEGASVSVTAIASGVNKTARTDKDGRFTITFPSAEGDYWVMIQHIGLAARRFEIKRLADEDVLIADTRLPSR